jgi:hypothetical protein
LSSQPNTVSVKDFKIGDRVWAFCAVEQRRDHPHDLCRLGWSASQTLRGTVIERDCWPDRRNTIYKVQFDSPITFHSALISEGIFYVDRLEHLSALDLLGEI